MSRSSARQRTRPEDGTRDDLCAPARSELPGNLLLGVVSTMVLLAVCEIGATLLAPREDQTVDTIATRNAALGLLSLPMPPWMVRDPDLLWAFRPSLAFRVCDEASGCTDHRTNALGFIGPEVRSPAGRPLVLCAGGSVTAGHGVADADGYPSVLESLLRATAGFEGAEVVNAGVYGYTSEQGRLLVPRLLEELRPDVVVLEYGINDNVLTVHPDRDLLGGSGASAAMRRTLARTSTYRLLRRTILRMRTARAVERRAVVPRVPPERHAENLRELIAAIRAHGARPILVAPSARWEQGVRPHVEWRRPESVFLHTYARVYRSIMMSVAADEGVPVFWDPTLTGNTPESRGRFLDWCHPDVEGLCMMARGLAPLVAGSLPQRR